MSEHKKPEEEYFVRVEAEKKARLARLLADADARREAERLKALHFHHCGKCGQSMMTTPFKGIEIEICPSCGAVLLDPGELERLAGADRHGVIDTVVRLFGFQKESGEETK
jgi:Zn-finger nucleic acid-binding protein